jgi:hypothetical protein
MFATIVTLLATLGVTALLATPEVTASMAELALGHGSAAEAAADPSTCEHSIARDVFGIPYSNYSCS